MTASADSTQPYAPDSVETPRMPQAPAEPLPPLACDAHCHVFGPYERFPLWHPSSYAAPDASAQRYLRMLDTLGAARGVLVQPAPYGTHPDALLDALAQGGDRLRGIAVADPSVSDAQLRALYDGGVRGLRFVEARNPAGNLFPGSVGFDQVAALAPRMKHHGLHAQLWAPCDTYLRHLPALAKLDLPLVIDHLGSLVPARGDQDPAFQLLRGLLADGRLWMKLTLCRVGSAPDYENARLLHDAFVAANPDQVLWGSDWPFVRMGASAPSADALVAVAQRWLGDDALRRKVWVDNPARLYGFD
ncbi:amidohydrolase family protein [Achromobacter ruhlandii]|uniref:2-pyrone-4,6-dicarboxylate hydrolase n=1 Tax=Achromobacter ruhlandii TaxID=72557 RepID=A0ABM8LRY0_9BURK|nr:amidohydrolase family protein [Achromobacter ruhlandii]AKP90058.1 putative hydrolase [Achromobacter xylosoxidans]AOU93116.1 2-pyrone-4,6-dicarboxylic acid hydrolase [Achromobacter ruhlandii]MCZ8433399.1 amidohydrolase family protein [Achromobacter ruhlandii]MDC6090788.1 amidohydrolase family protein [Achromobacter ruhlandii]MDC6148720.1 amidohydrolase family protein [Achromobacter ruhlandii]